MSVPYDASQALISVIVPTRNRPELLVRALSSIFHQEYRPLEVLVINDGGETVDSSVRAIASCSEISVTVLNHAEQRGLSAARNSGLKASCGASIAYLDDDDTWQPGLLMHLASGLASSRAELVYSDYERVTFDQDPQSGTLTEREREAVVTPAFDRRLLLQSNIMAVNCVLHRRELLDRFGYFDEELTGLEDWDLWLRCSRTAAFCKVPGLGAEVTRIIGRPGMTERQRFGFVWPSLNIIYKLLRDEIPPSENLADGAARATENLIAHTALEVGALDPAGWETVYSFHSPARVAQRVAWLRKMYPSLQARLCLLEALVQLVARDGSAALSALDEGIAIAPDDLDLTSLRRSLVE